MKQSPDDPPGLFSPLASGKVSRDSAATNSARHSRTRKARAGMTAPHGTTIVSRLYEAPLEHRDIFQERDDAEHDDDHAADLLGAAIERQHVDQIENEDNDKKGDEHTDKHR
jgi:hypothetical protein